MNQRLGSYIFEWNPDRYSIPGKEKSFSMVETYSSVGWFSWGMFEKKTITLEWDWMSLAQYNAIKAIFEQDVQTSWTDGKTIAYTVEINDFGGDYFENYGIDLAYRENVKLELYMVAALTYTATTTSSTTTTTTSSSTTSTTN